MLRKLTVNIMVEAQVADDSPLAPLVVEALQEFIERSNETSIQRLAGKFESKDGLDVTWAARNEYFDDLGNLVNIDEKPMPAAVNAALKNMPARRNA
jgi:hypothetical protein